MSAAFGITNTLYEEIKQAAITAYPQEMCGYVYNGKFFRLENKAAQPDREVMIDLLEWTDILERTEGRIVFIHSHPDWWPVPSETDMISQEQMGCPWGIISVRKGAEGFDVSPLIFLSEDNLKAPLVGRGFVHAISDCYELIRGWYYQEKDIFLPSFPRSWEWWNDGKNLYKDGFAKAGFRVIDMTTKGNSPMIGDVFLAQLRSPVINHGGIYLGNGLGLHHLSGRSAYQPETLSKHEPILRFQPYITLWLRHESNSTPC